VSEVRSHPAHQFGDIVQQHEAATLAMWLFLVTEIMFFGALFTGYAYSRYRYPEPFAIASQHLDVRLGAVNTAVLIGSSLTMALAVRAAQIGRRRGTAALLVATMALGTVFLVIKAYEYYDKAEHHLVPGWRFDYHGSDTEEIALYYTLYFIMTGTHALHMVIGIVVLGVLARLAVRGRYSTLYYTPIEMAGLYWHFVDIVWIFLFPMLYLLGRH
jgi:cytochrome c oxidase subunit 3